MTHGSKAWAKEQIASGMQVAHSHWSARNYLFGDGGLVWSSCSGQYNIDHPKVPESGWQIRIREEELIVVQGELLATEALTDGVDAKLSLLVSGGMVGDDIADRLRELQGRTVRVTIEVLD